ncbi:MAG TPA: FAD-dependent oxidoreductase [Gemmatimonadaceae bacterium]|nr:FAD-dependent oxidoreductase [Gemmatimonadaceae bacterium]
MSEASRANGTEAVSDCDVLVVGGGPAGIAAASRAAESGAKVVMVDQGMRPGGQVWRHREESDLPRLARVWLDRLRGSGAHCLAMATVTDVTSDGTVSLAHREGSSTVRAGALVIATGARELFIPYPGWTLPGAMGIGGAQALLKGGMRVRGKRVVIAGSGPLILPVAAAMARAGARLAAVLEQAPAAALARFARTLWRHPSKLADGARYRSAFARTSYRTGSWVARAEGEGRVERVTLTDGRRQWSEECDLLCCSYGLVPNVDLASLLGCAIDDGMVVVDAAQRTSIPSVYAAGEPTGVGGELAALTEGEIAGLSAAGRDIDVSLARARLRWRAFATQLALSFRPRPELRELAEPDTIICRCEDVPLSRIDPSWSVRQAKLYTRVGMGPCQGGVCGPACRFLFSWPHGRVRPPLGAPEVGAVGGAEREE